MAVPAQSPILRSITAIYTILIAVASASSDSDPIVLNEISRASNQSLLWGPYRPNLYFGVKPRVPDSFISGLMWSGVNDYKTFEDSEWSCTNGIT